jgi:uncharacterized surface protein with fasciclin (FAS1) repeats
MTARRFYVTTASVLTLFLSLGATGTASAGHGGYNYQPTRGYPSHPGYHHGYGMPHRHGYGGRGYGPRTGYSPYPMHGYSGGAHAPYGYGEPHGRKGACGATKAGYMVKTGGGTGDVKPVPATGDIVDVAVAAGSFDTLVAAVKAADLVETLKGAGPFTVFAPTDEAFAKIPKGDLDALLADKEKLTAVLTYHVVPGKVMAADVVKLDSVTTVQGGSVSIDTSDGVKVDDANVVKTDIAASNGVIHVIDAVIMPE